MGKMGDSNSGKNDRKGKSKMYHQKQGRYQRGGRGRGGYSGGRQYVYFGPGMKGFLCTTNSHEKDAVKEAYNLLNEYYEEKDDQQVTGPREGDETNVVGGGTKPKEDDEEDIEAALKQEIEGMKDNAHRFQSIDTGVRNVVFINTTINDPVKLGHKILEDITSTKEQKSRFLLRMIPIELTCRAELQTILTNAKELFQKYLKTGCNSYQIVYKARYNNSLNREAVIKLLAEAVSDANPMNVVNLNDPTFSVMVEIVKGVCCLSILSDFNKFRKYNLLETTTEKAPPRNATGESESQEANKVTENEDVISGEEPPAESEMAADS